MILIFSGGVFFKIFFIYLYIERIFFKWVGWVKFENKSILIGVGIRFCFFFFGGE